MEKEIQRKMGEKKTPHKKASFFQQTKEVNHVRMLEKLKKTLRPARSGKYIRGGILSVYFTVCLEFSFKTL